MQTRSYLTIPPTSTASGQRDITNPSISLGGIKQSGLGREGGRAGLDGYPETKYYCLSERITNHHNQGTRIDS